jgi:hypothetical protein
LEPPDERVAAVISLGKSSMDPPHPGHEILAPMATEGENRYGLSCGGEDVLGKF